MISPDSIKGTHDSAIGNFGIPQYGGSMAGTVVYPKDNRKGCRGFDESGISFKSKPGALPSFVLVDRGGKYPFSNFGGSMMVLEGTLLVNFVGSMDA